jgi:hypothetical protein
MAGVVLLDHLAQQDILLCPLILAPRFELVFLDRQLGDGRANKDWSASAAVARYAVEMTHRLT